MPYKNIVFIKLFLRLFEEDDRFLYQLNESQQLLFIKMLYMSAITDNQIPKNSRFICSKINYNHEEECLFKDLSRISEVFRGFKIDDKSYSFNNFYQLHNYIGKSQGNPTLKSREFPDKEKSKRRVREEKKVAYAPDPKEKQKISELIKQTIKYGTI